MFGLSLGIHILAAWVSFFAGYFWIQNQRRKKSLARLYAADSSPKLLNLHEFIYDVGLMLGIPIDIVEAPQNPIVRKVRLDLIRRVFFHQKVKCVKIQGNIIQLVGSIKLSDQELHQLREWGLEIGDL